MHLMLLGHLLFEMCCGYELTTVSPRKQEYKSVQDKLLKTTLQYIFEDGFPHSIEEVGLCIVWIQTVSPYWLVKCFFL